MCLLRGPVPRIGTLHRAQVTGVSASALPDYVHELPQGFGSLPQSRVPHRQFERFQAVIPATQRRFQNLGYLLGLFRRGLRPFFSASSKASAERSSLPNHSVTAANFSQSSLRRL